MSIPKLVAHRGYATRFPENTLLSIEEALKVGAHFVEFDVQCTADGVPVVFHDASLERTTGIQKNLLELPSEKIRNISACETTRFGQKFSDQNITIPSLAQVVSLLKEWPQTTAFVEIKTESLTQFGIAAVLKTVITCITPILKQCCVISYDDLALRAARKMGVQKIGWVLKTWSDQQHDTTKELMPNYLICNYKKIPHASTPLWSGPWQWCFYEVTDPELALKLHARGAELIETMDIAGMLADPRLRIKKRVI